MQKCINTAMLVLFFLSGFGATLNAQSDYDPAFKFTRALTWIERYYVDSVRTDKLVEDAIVGMLKDLDPHTTYMTKEEVKEMNEPLQGNFEGIGVSFSILRDTILVIKPVAGGPSEKAGVKAGDKIIEINGENVAGKGITNDGVFQRLKGPQGTTVSIAVKRQETPDVMSFQIERGKIPIYSLDAAYMISPGIAYIRINRFAATTSREFINAFEDLKKQKAKSLILDLSDNGGGYLEEAVRLADYFIPKGRLLLYTQGKNSPKSEYMSTSFGGFESGDLVIIINEGSASASEILTGAIQDWDRGIVIGRRSFGKGLVQRPLPLPDSSMIRLTVARYYTPSGRCIQKSYKNGIEAYEQDLAKRYQHGELIHADSIHFPDSLRYYTLVKKRSVYGGGGIMPDIFVPLDTSSYSPYYRNLIGKGILNRFVLLYIDHHRKDLMNDYPDFDQFNTKFQVTELLFNDLLNYAVTQSLAIDTAGVATSREQIERLMKAYIARDLFDTNEFFRVYNESDITVQKAVQVMCNINNYW